MTETAGADRTEELAAVIREAGARNEPVFIRGAGTKLTVLGRGCSAPELDVSGHRGITDYQPSELLLTARGGTALVEIEAALAQEGQVLPFEPPLFDGKATLGGTVASNLSGPARPWAGSARDLVLGVQLIDGSGEVLNFGGKVMKNVAGYDVSRLQAGALGTLGVLAQISLKVLPRAEHSITLAYQMDAAEAIATMNKRAGQPAPLNGACWLEGTLFLRLSGDAGAVAHTAEIWGGEQVHGKAQPWVGLREMTSPFFAGDDPLWRLSVKSTAAPLPDPANMLIDWGGAQRWLRGDLELPQLQAIAAAAGGHATLFRGGDRAGEVRPAPDPVNRRLQERLKHSFDPLRVLNPGRLYGWL